MTKLTFSWGISDPDAEGQVMVRCHIDGTDLTTVFGPMPHQVADSFIRAKRSWLDRRIRRMTDAVHLFTPQPGARLQ